MVEGKPADIGAGEGEDRSQPEALMESRLFRQDIHHCSHLQLPGALVTEVTKHQGDIAECWGRGGACSLVDEVERAQ